MERNTCFKSWRIKGRRDGYAILRFKAGGKRRVYHVSHDGAISRGTRRGWCDLALAVARQYEGAVAYIHHEHYGPATYGHATDFVALP